MTIYVFKPSESPSPIPLTPAYQRGGVQHDDLLDLMSYHEPEGAIYYSDEPEFDMGFKAPKQVLTLSNGTRFEVEEHYTGALTVRSLDGSLRLEPVMGNRIDLLVI